MWWNFKNNYTLDNSGRIDINLKYKGSRSIFTNRVAYASFNNPYCLGSPTMLVTNTPSYTQMTNLTLSVTNATLFGLKGTNYVCAWIDTVVTNGIREANESWGFYRQSDINPVAVPIVISEDNPSSFVTIDLYDN